MNNNGQLNGRLKGEIMEGNKIRFKSIEEYILQFSPEVQEILITIRKVIKRALHTIKKKTTTSSSIGNTHTNR